MTDQQIYEDWLSTYGDDDHGKQMFDKDLMIDFAHYYHDEKTYLQDDNPKTNFNDVLIEFGDAIAITICLIGFFATIIAMIIFKN